MKKKIINGIMMVALVAATSTSFVSCKDTNEDVRVEMQGEYATLLGKLNALESKYGDLDGRVSTLETKVKNMAEDIATLQTEVNSLETWLVEAFAKLVYGVEISGTYNNMTGSINIPGFEPKMLITNYGTAANTVVFPKSDIVKDEDKVKIGQGEEIGTEDAQTFAGYIYANVNRYLDSTPMLSKFQSEDAIFDITIANTAGEDVDGLFVMNTDKEGGANKDVLSWGWTRADNNIFKFAVGYQGGKAKAEKDFVPAKIDLEKFKTDLKAVWADRNRATGTSKESLGHLAADLYYNLATKDYNLKKYALKFAWEDATALNESNEDYTTNKDSETGDVISYDASKEEKIGLKHIVTSEAELVFAAIKPLGFNGGGALAENVQKNVGSVNKLVEKAEVVENKIFDKIKAQIPNFQPIENITVVESDGSVPANEKGKIYFWADKYYLINTNNLIANITTPVNDYDVTDLTSIIALVFSTVEQANAGFDAVDNIKAKLKDSTINNWVEKFTNKFATLVNNNADQILTPTLLAIAKDGTVNRVSGLKASPLEASGEITLKPTSYSAEVFAPAYAKFVGCKDITADGFNEVMLANDKVLKFTPEAGKLYEIVYEAVDFFGNTFEHTYYIQGK